MERGTEHILHLLSRPLEQTNGKHAAQLCNVREIAEAIRVVGSRVEN